MGRQFLCAKRGLAGPEVKAWAIAVVRLAQRA
jgi:hypothetical protein